MAADADTYAGVMQRNKLASERLRLQLFLWRVRYGWSLPPVVPLAENSGWEVVDVGTGSGGWLLDMAAEFPEAKFLGLDISSDQFPAPESLPTHVSFVGGFDIYNELPEEYVGRFNVVHARLLFGAVRNYDPLPILNNFIKMLKPGGYLVWDDLNVLNHFKHDTTKPELPAYKITPPAGFTMPNGHWLDKLANTYKENGLEEVMEHDKDITPQWLGSWNHLVTWGSEEHLNTLIATHGPEFPKLKTQRAHLNIVYEDTAKGLLTSYQPTIVSGRKPLNATNGVNGHSQNPAGDDARLSNGLASLGIRS